MTLIFKELVLSSSPGLVGYTSVILSDEKNKWKNSNVSLCCPFCNEHNNCVFHRIFQCCHFTEQRSDFFFNVRTGVSPSIGDPFLAGSSSVKLGFILGEEAFKHGGHAGFIFEKHVRLFLKGIFM